MLTLLMNIARSEWRTFHLGTRGATNWANQLLLDVRVLIGFISHVMDRKLKHILYSKMTALLYSSANLLKDGMTTISGVRVEDLKTGCSGTFILQTRYSRLLCKTKKHKRKKTLALRCTLFSILLCPWGES